MHCMCSMYVSDSVLFSNVVSGLAGRVDLVVSVCGAAGELHTGSSRMCASGQVTVPPPPRSRPDPPWLSGETNQ